MTDSVFLQHIVTLQLEPLGLWSNSTSGSVERMKEMIEEEWHWFQSFDVDTKLKSNFSISLNYYISFKQLALP